MEGNSNQKAGEVIIQINIPPVSITVTSNEESQLENLLKKSLDLLVENQEKILGLIAKSASNGRKTMITEVPRVDNSRQSAENETSITNIVKVFDDGSVKLQGKKVFELKGAEVIALIMGALRKPLRPVDISSIVTTAWKNVSDEAVSVYLRRELKPYVTKNDEGKYYLNGAGEHWILNELLPKCLND